MVGTVGSRRGDPQVPAALPARTPEPLTGDQRPCPVTGDDAHCATRAPFREAALSSTVCVPGPLTRLVRRHGFTRSALRRSTDRVEAGVAAVLAVLALVTVLLATVVAMSTYRQAQSEAATKAAQQASVTAVLLTNAAVPFTDSPEQGVAGHATAVTRWPLPSGQQRTAPLWVSADRHAGDRMLIWIDQLGNRVDPPQTPGSMIADAVAYGIAVLAGGWVLLGGLWWSVCQVLGRINAARWDLDWTRTDPGWSHRTSQ